MALINTPKTSTFDDWRINTNTTASQLGDNATLVANTTLSSTNAVDAILEVLAKEQLEVGDVSTLTTTATNLSAAVVELDADVGNKATLTTTAKTNLVAAVNELDAEHGTISTLTTTAKTTFVAAINELDAEHGVLSTLTTTHNTTLVGSINEVRAKLVSDVGDKTTLTTTSKTSMTTAINELDSDVGDKTTLTTTSKTNLVAAVNELDADVGDKSTLNTTSKTNLVSAVNEVFDREASRYSNTVKLDLTHSTVDGNNSTSQDIKSNLILSGSEIRLASGSVLDLRDAQLLIGGGAGTFNFNAAYIQVGNKDIETAGNGGIYVERGTVYGTTVSTSITLTTVAGSAVATASSKAGLAVGDLVTNAAFVSPTLINSISSTTNELTLSSPATANSTNSATTFKRKTADREDAAVFWDETNSRWAVRRFSDVNKTNVITPFLVDSTNIADFITGNTESGIDVTYNTSTNKINFDVSDFTISLTGDVTGTGTVTNLGNVSFAATIQPNSVALGTDTTGAYVASIGLAASNPGLTVTQSAAGAESNALTNLTVDSTVIRDFGAQTIAGVKTFSAKPIFSDGITVGDASTDTSSFNGYTTFNHNVEVKGNLTVSGTATYVNTETVTINDNIIVLNNNAPATPTENAGIEVERGTATNVSVLWDEANDDWTFYNGTSTYYMTGQIVAGNAITVSQDSTERAKWTVNHADTSSVANLSSDNSGSTYIQDISFTFDTYGHVTAATVATSTEEPAFKTISINGTDSGYTWGTANVNTDQVAESVTDTLTLVRGGGLNFYTSTVAGTDAIKIEHADTSSVANLSSDNSSNTFIQDISFTFDTYGHVTAATVATGTVAETNAYSKVSISDDGTPFTWGAANVNTAQEADAVNDTLTIVRGGGINLYTGSTAALDSIKIEHADTSTQASVNNSGYTYIQDITLDTYGHLTAITSATWSATLANITNSTEDIQDIVGTMVAPTNTEDGLTVTYDDVNGKLNFNVNDPIIALTGAVTGSGTMINLGDVSIATTLDTSSTAFQDGVKALMPKIYDVNGTQVFP